MKNTNGSIILHLIIAAVIGLIIYSGVQTILNSDETQQVKEQTDSIIDQAEKTQEEANQILERGKEVINLN